MGKGIHDANFERIGDGIPILNLHGWSRSSDDAIRLFEPVFEKHSGWQRIYLDLPGHGTTPGHPWIKNSDGMLDFVKDFIELSSMLQRRLIMPLSYIANTYSISK